MLFTPVTREEVDEARAQFQNARTVYNNAYFNFLTTVLIEAGVYKKLVRIKETDVQGQFKVADNPYTPQPWKIAFFPVRQAGGISSKTKNLPNFIYWREDNLVEQLKNICEVVGDLP